MRVQNKSFFKNFILFFVLLPFLSKPQSISGWRPAIAFLYLFIFHSLLRLTSILSIQKCQEVCQYVYNFGSWPVHRAGWPAMLDAVETQTCLGLKTFAHLLPLFFFFWTKLCQLHCPCACANDYFLHLNTCWSKSLKKKLAPWHWQVVKCRQMNVWSVTANLQVRSLAGQNFCTI